MDNKKKEPEKHLLGVKEIHEMFHKYGMKFSYGKVFYLVKYVPSFPKPVPVPGYKRPKWNKEQVKEWLEKVVRGELPEQKDAMAKGLDFVPIKEDKED